MIAEHTKAAVLAILAVDSGVTDSERVAIENVMSGRRIHPGGIVTIRNAASRLGVHYNTVLKYVKAGRLNPIMGSGERAIGISEESFERFLEGKGNEKKSQIR